MNASDREAAVRLAEATADLGGLPTTQTLLARGLLAEHGEVLAGRDKIRTLQTAVEDITALSVANAQRFADDLAAAHGVTSRLRAAAINGASGHIAARAVRLALSRIGSDDPDASDLGAGYLALSEEHKATRAELAALRDGIALVLAVTPRS